MHSTKKVDDKIWFTYGGERSGRFQNLINKVNHDLHYFIFSLSCTCVCVSAVRVLCMLSVVRVLCVRMPQNRIFLWGVHVSNANPRDLLTVYVLRTGRPRRSAVSTPRSPPILTWRSKLAMWLSWSPRVIWMLALAGRRNWVFTIWVFSISIGRF